MAIKGESVSQLLNALQSVLTQAAKPSRALKTILSQAVAHTGADRGVFVEITTSGEMAFKVLYRYEKEELTGDAAHFSRGVLASVLKSGKGVRVANALDDPCFASNESIQAFKLTSVLCMPIEVDGKVAALVHLESNEQGHFKEEHEELLGSLLSIASPALGALRASQGVLNERDALRRSESQAREEIKESREQLAQDWSYGRFIGRHERVRELETTLRKAAKMGYPVLLQGETGTGKSILARVLHHLGDRSKQALVTVFCPSLEKGMVETELFGHKRGAFTGAVADRIGKIQAAEKGSLFLDEIGELPLDIQPKLLRLLQEKSYEKVGDPTERSADVWVIAATNRDLEAEVREGRFRRDLYERLNFVPVRIPPLRERPSDIPLLLRHCLDKHEAGRWVELSDPALEFLSTMDFAWPGNVRSVEQLAVRLAMDDKGAAVEIADIERLLGAGAAPGPEVRSDDDISLDAGLPALLAQEEKKWIEEAMRRYPDISRAELAQKLKVSESALYKKLRLYDIT
jgi:Nif-specific regulatory protein